MPTWAGRAYSAAVPGWRQLAGSVLATAGGRLGQGRLWELVRCRVRTAGIGARGAALAALPAPLGDHRRPGRRGPGETSRITPAATTPAPPAGMITAATPLDRNAASRVAACRG